MESKLFPIFITLLGLLAGYVFYAFWHTEKLNNTLIPEKILEDLLPRPTSPLGCIVQHKC